MSISNLAMQRVGFFRGMMLSLGLAAAIAPGCSAAKGPKYPDENAYCNGRAEAECNSEVIKACAVANATRCIASRQHACVAALPTGMRYNADGAENCVNAVSGAYGDAKVTAEENESLAATCRLLFDGPGLEKASCKADIECQVSSGLRCVRPGGSATGSCRIPQSVQGGGSCAAPDQLCVDGFHCGVSQHCDIDSKENEACSDAIPCTSTTRCANGVCVKKLDDGASCTTDAECAHDICQRGMSDAEGLCVSQLTLAPNEPFCREAR